MYIMKAHTLEEADQKLLVKPWILTWYDWERYISEDGEECYCTYAEKERSGRLIQVIVKII